MNAIGLPKLLNHTRKRAFGLAGQGSTQQAARQTSSSSVVLSVAHGHAGRPASLTSRPRAFATLLTGTTKCPPAKSIGPMGIKKAPVRHDAQSSHGKGC